MSVQQSSVRTRSANGDARIFQRGNSWVSTVSMGLKADGSRNRKTVTGPTQKAVRAKIREIELAHANGMPIPNENTTVRCLIDDWLRLVIKPNLAPKSYESYAFLCTRYIIPNLGNHKLIRLDVRTVQEFLQNQHDSGLSPATVRHIRAVLRNAVNQAMRWDMVGRNIVSFTVPTRRDLRLKKVYTEEDAVRLITVFRGCRYGDLLMFLLGTGLRIGEALGLRWEDVDLDHADGSRIRVEYQLQYLAGRYQLTTPKSDSSRRIILIPHVIVGLLRGLSKNPVNSMNLVFVNSIGGPIDASAVRKVFHSVLAEHGIKDMRIHDLRHVCATLLLTNGVDLLYVQNLLGHSNYSLTANTYAHVTVKHMGNVTETLNRILGQFHG